MARGRTALFPPSLKLRRTGLNARRSLWRRRVADGKAVWSWHPLLVLNLRRRVGPTGHRQTFNPLMTVTRRIRSPGRARNKPLKPLRAGMPGDPGEPSGDYARVLCFISHARLRVRRAPGIPHALCFSWAHRSRTTRAQSRRGNAEVCLMKTNAPHSQPSSSANGSAEWPPDDRLRRTIQYSETLMMELRGRGVLDRPVKPDDDNFLWSAAFMRRCRHAVIARSQRVRPSAGPMINSATKQSILSCLRYGLLGGACHRARIRATRWLAMTICASSLAPLAGRGLG